MKLPAYAINHYDELIHAFEIKYQNFVLQGKHNQHKWRACLDMLRNSTNPVYIQERGENKNAIKGLPKKFKPDMIQFCVRVVTGVEDIVALNIGQQQVNVPQNHNTGHASPRTRDVRIEDTQYYVGRKYRDGPYALLAAMYSRTDSFPLYMVEKHIQRAARLFTDHTVAKYDYRNKSYGIGNSIKTLESHQYVQVDRAIRPFRYALTREGLQYCYCLFNLKFHPSKGPYELVKPPAGWTVTEAGSLQRCGHDDDTFGLTQAQAQAPQNPYARDEPFPTAQFANPLNKNALWASDGFGREETMNDHTNHNDREHDFGIREHEHELGCVKKELLAPVDMEQVRLARIMKFGDFGSPVPSGKAKSSSSTSSSSLTAARQSAQHCSPARHEGMWSQGSVSSTHTQAHEQQVSELRSQGYTAEEIAVLVPEPAVMSPVKKTSTAHTTGTASHASSHSATIDGSSTSCSSREQAINELVDSGLSWEAAFEVTMGMDTQTTAHSATASNKRSLATATCLLIDSHPESSWCKSPHNSAPSSSSSSSTSSSLSLSHEHHHTAATPSKRSRLLNDPTVRSNPTISSVQILDLTQTDRNDSGVVQIELDSQGEVLQEYFHYH